MTVPAAIAGLAGRTDELVDRLEDWANVNSGSGNPAGLARMREVLREAFARSFPEARIEEPALEGPDGRFVLASAPGRPLVFLACDLGFAPVKSLVEYALSVDEAASYRLAWLSTRAGGHYLANQCRAWAEALDGFSWR
ncbi:MAG: hypothetical protein ACKOUK_11340, partial [Verrucomicrobiota bacterium]